MLDKEVGPFSRRRRLRTPNFLESLSGSTRRIPSLTHAIAANIPREGQARGYLVAWVLPTGCLANDQDGPDGFLTPYEFGRFLSTVAPNYCFWLMFSFLNLPARTLRPQTARP